MSDVDRLRGEISFRVMNNESVVDECENFHAKLDGSDRKYYRSWAKIKQENFSVIYNTPVNTGTIFITVSDADPALIGQVYSNLEQVEEKGHAIVVGSLWQFQSDRLFDNGVYGVTFLPIFISNVLGEMEEKFTKDQKNYQFLLATFLSEEDYHLHLTNGFDALMEKWDEVGKDLVSFSQSQ